MILREIFPGTGPADSPYSALQAKGLAAGGLGTLLYCWMFYGGRLSIAARGGRIALATFLAAGAGRVAVILWQGCRQRQSARANPLSREPLHRLRGQGWQIVSKTRIRLISMPKPHPCRGESPLFTGTATGVTRTASAPRASTTGVAA